MDHGQGENKTFWWVGCLVCLLLVACVIQWMDGWRDGCCVDKGGTGCGGGRSAFPAMQTKYRQHLGKNRVAWFGLLGLLVACLFDGWMDGWSVDNGGRGWMHKWMECK